MSFANTNKIYVATYKEIIIVFISFVLILIVLNPKDVLLTQVLNENSNYDLSMLYLQNMLKNDPSNETLMLSLAQQAYTSGRKDLAFKLLKLLRKSKNPQIYAETYKLSYKIAKEDYYYLKTAKKKEALKKKYREMQKIFATIIKKHFYTNKEKKELYKESLFLHNKRVAYKFAQQFLRKQPHSVKLLKENYYLSSSLHHYRVALYYLEQLTKKDRRAKKKWLDAIYFLLLQHYPYDKAQTYLIEHAKQSKYWEKRLVNFYLQHKEYKKTAKVYMDAFHNATTYQEQKEFWFKTLQTLQAGGELKSAVAIASRYENYFFNDEKSRIFLLKLYLSANALKKANRLAQKILKIKQR